ncbi:MAG: hypothetical protein IJF94_05185, partial [Eubacterium sp.]|nr:hypothetical protein [Eubacterium sp.]
MSKELPKRYYSEEQVKKALNIDSFRNLTKDKVMEFTSMIPYMDKEVATSAINQFPQFAAFGKTAIESYSSICQEIIKSSSASQQTVAKAYQTILDGLKVRLESESITEKERKTITSEMLDIADKIAEADLNNKKLINRTITKIGLAILGAGAMIAAGLGISSKIGGS